MRLKMTQNKNKIRQKKTNNEYNNMVMSLNVLPVCTSGQSTFLVAI